MIGKRHEIAWLQSDFYRDQYRKILRWIIGAIFIMFVLIAMIIYFIWFEPLQDYFANTTEGVILPMPEQRGSNGR